MVFPVFDTEFEVNTEGRTSPGTFATIADLETFEMTFDNGVEEWNPMDTKGWVRRLMTAKSVSITLSGKRNYGDPGNDYCAGLALLSGNDTVSQMKITFPNGDIFQMDCVMNVSNIGGGASTDVSPLEIEAMSDGKPTYTPAPNP